MICNIEIVLETNRIATQGYKGWSQHKLRTFVDERATKENIMVQSF
jgi:hypothetical protein